MSFHRYSFRELKSISRRYRLAARGICAVLIVMLVSPPLFAAEPFVDIPAKDRTLRAFDVYLDRADRKSDPAAWWRTAEYGLKVITASWEHEAAVMLSSGEELELAGERFESQLEAALEKRFTEWSVTRFFRDQMPGLRYRTFFEAVSRANRSYLYDTDENGAIRYSETGDPKLKKSEGAAAARTVWNREVSEEIEFQLKRWRANWKQLPADLASAVDDEQLAHARYGERFSVYAAALEREFQLLLQQQERRFFAKRTRDQFSLRSKSEQATASAVTKRLIAAADSRTGAALERLRSGLAVEGGDDEEGAELDIDPEQWRESFQKQFDAGMAVWERAERDLLVQRMEWERRAGEDFHESEQAWMRAYEMLAEERRSWQRSLAQVLEEGEERWRVQEEALERELSNARVELERKIREREASFEERLTQTVELLLQAKQTMATAKESIEFWLDSERINAEYLVETGEFAGNTARSLWHGAFRHHIECEAKEREEPNTSSIAEEFAQYLRARLQERTEYFGLNLEQGESPFNESSMAAFRETFRSEHLELDKEKRIKARSRNISSHASAMTSGEIEQVLDAGTAIFRTALEALLSQRDFTELAYWHKLWDTYSSYAAEAKESLTETYGIVLYGQEAAPGETAETSYGEVYKEMAWEDLYLDDYQVELVKAKMRARYWDEQVEIAEAVYAYAIDHSSGRPEEALTQRRYAEALRNYQGAQEEHAQAVVEVRAAGAVAEELRGGPEGIAELQTRLSALRQKLSASKREYRRAFTDYTLDTTEASREEMTEYYRELLITRGLSNETPEQSLSSARMRYWRAARSYGSAEELRRTEQHLRRLVRGNAAEEILSLAALRQQVTSVEEWQFSEDEADFRISLSDGKPEKEGLGLERSGATHTRLLSEHEAYRQAKAYGQEAVARQKRSLIEYLVKDLEASRRAFLESRKDAISLLTAGDISMWAAQVNLAGEGQTPAALERAAAKEAGRLETEVIRKRVALELEAISLLLEKSDSQDNGGSNRLELNAFSPDDPRGFLARALLRRAEVGGGSAVLERTQLEDLQKQYALILDFIDRKVLSGKETVIAAHREEVLALIEGEAPVLRNILSGRGTFYVDGIDLAGLLTSESRNRAVRMRNLAATLRAESEEAFTLRNIRIREAFNSAMTVLERYRVIERSGDTIRHVPLSEIPLGENPEAREEMLRSLTSELSGPLAELPDYAAAQISRTVEALSSYCALQSSTVLDVETVLRKQKENSSALEKIHSWLYEVQDDIRELSSGDDSAALLVTAYRAYREAMDATELKSKVAERFSKGTEELRETVISVFSAELARDVRAAMDRTGYTEDSTERIEALFDARCAAIGMGEWTEEMREEVLSRARELLHRGAIVGGDIQLADWSGESEETRAAYRFTLWNDFDPGRLMHMEMQEGKERETLDLIASMSEQVLIGKSEESVEAAALRRFLGQRYLDGRGTSVGFYERHAKLLAKADAPETVWADLTRDLVNRPQLVNARAGAIYAALEWRQTIDERIAADGMPEETDWNSSVEEAWHTSSKELYEAVGPEHMERAQEYYEAYTTDYRAVLVETERTSALSPTVEIEQKKGVKRLLGVSEKNSLLQTSLFTQAAFTGLLSRVAGELEKLFGEAVVEENFNSLVRILTAGYASKVDLSTLVTLGDASERQRNIAAAVESVSLPEEYATSLPDDGGRVFALSLDYMRRMHREPAEKRTAASRDFLRSLGLENAEKLKTALQFGKTLYGVNRFSARQRALSELGIRGELLSFYRTARQRAISGETYTRAVLSGLQHALSGRDDLSSAEQTRYAAALSSLFCNEDLPSSAGSGMQADEGERYWNVFSGTRAGREFAAKRLLLAGYNVPGDTSVGSPALLREIEQLGTAVNAAQSYFGLFDAAPGEYLMNALGRTSLLEAALAASAIEEGAYSAIHLADETLQSSGIEDGHAYLENLAAIRSRYALELSRAAARLLEKERKVQAVHAARLSRNFNFYSRVGEMMDRRDSGKKNYRAYLSGNFLRKTEEAEDDTAEHEGGADTVERVAVLYDEEGRIEQVEGGYDKNGNARAGEWFGNELLEVANIHRTTLRETIDLYREEEQARTEEDGSFEHNSYYERYFSTYGGILGENGDVQETVPAEALFETEDSQAAVEFEDAQQHLGRLQNLRKELEKDIIRLGTGLIDYWNAEQGSVDDILEAKRRVVESLEIEIEKLGFEWRDAIALLAEADAEYERKHAAAQRAEKNLHTADLQLQKVEAILEFAGSGYLLQKEDNPKGAKSDVQAVADPEQRLLHARQKNTAAQAAFDALDALYNGTTVPEDFMHAINQEKGEVYRTAFQDYRRHYKDMIILKRLTGLFDRAVSRQQQRAEKANRESREALKELFRLELCSPENEELTEVLNSETTVWQDHIVLTRNGDTLPEVKFAERNTAEGKKALYQYLTAPKNPNEMNNHGPSLEEDMAEWSYRMDSFIQRNGSGKLNEWGSAYWYWMNTLAARSKSGAAAALTKAYVTDTKPEKLLGHSEVASFIEKNGNKLLVSRRLPIEYARHLKKRGKQIFEHMEGEEKKLFTFFIMLKKLDMVSDTAFLQAGAEAEVRRFVEEKLRDGKKYHHRRRNGSLIKNVIGFLNPITFFIRGVDWWYHHNWKKKFGAHLSSVASRRKGSIQARNTSRSVFTRNIKNYTLQRNNWSEKTHALSEMRGRRNGAGRIGADDLTASLTLISEVLDESLFELLVNDSGGGRANEEGISGEKLLRNLIRRHSATIEEGGWPDVHTALTVLKRSARDTLLHSAAELSAQGAALRKEQDKAESEYASAVEAVLQGKVGEEEVEAYLGKAAAQAFSMPRFSLQQHQRRMQELVHAESEGLDPVERPRMMPTLAALWGGWPDAAELTTGMNNLKHMYRSRMEHYREIRNAEWQIKADDLRRRGEKWKETMAAIAARGESEWNNALRQFESERRAWIDEFKGRYKSRTKIWGAKYASLKEKKADWVEHAAEEAEEVGRAAILEQLGLRVERSAASAGAILIPEMEREPVDPEKLVEDFMTAGSVGALFEQTKQMKAHTARINTNFYVRPGGNRFRTTNLLDAIRRHQADDSRKIADHIALITARSAREDIRGAIQELYEQGKVLNEHVKSGIEKTLLRAGYRHAGGHYSRRVAVYATLFEGTKYARQRIEDYRFYEMPQVELETDLRDVTLERLEGKRIELQLERALAEIGEKHSLIFGGDGPVTRKKLGRRTREFRPDEFEKKSNYRKIGKRRKWQEFGRTFITAKKIYDQERRPGLFGEHVGWAPELVDRPNPEKTIEKNLDIRGTGEMGRIMRPFLDHQLKESQGLNLASGPMYDLPMWDDRHGAASWMNAPTLRSTAGVAAAVAAGVATGGAGSVLGAALIGGAVATSDDVLFGALDVAGGHRQFSDVAVDVGTSAAINTGVSVIGSAVGGADELAGGGLFEEGINGMLVDSLGSETLAGTLSTGIEMTGTNVFSSGLRAMEWKKLGSRDWWNGRRFEKGVSGTAAMAGYLGGMGGSFINSGLDESVYGVVGKSYRDVKALNSLAGNATNVALQYGLTNRASINVLNTGDFGIRANTGLFELSFGGREGFSGAFSTGGIGMGAGTMIKALGGFSVHKMAGDIRRSGYQGEEAVAMRLLGTTGLAAADARYRQLLDGRAKWDRDMHIDGQGVTTQLPGGDIEMRINPVPSPKEGLQLGVVLVHEAYRNGIDDGLTGQKRETLQAVTGHMAAATMAAASYGMESLNAGMRGEVERFRSAGTRGSWKELGDWALDTYDGSGELWRLLTYADGTNTILNDGTSDLLIEYMDYRRDKSGNIIRDEHGDPLFQQLSTAQVEAEIGSQAGALAQYMGIERMRELLGFDTSELRNFDDDTLQDVLDLSRNEISAIRNGSPFFAEMSNNERDRLMGEALLKKHRMRWDKKSGQWVGESPLALTMTDTPTLGLINVASLGDGIFDRSTATVSVSRDPLSYLIYKDSKGPYKEYNGLDSVTISSYELDGVERDTRTFDGWTTVQNSFPGYDEEKMIGYDYDAFMNMSETTLYGGVDKIKVGPETVMEGDIAWTIDILPDAWIAVGMEQGATILKYSAGQILAGNRIDAKGNAGFNGGRHLIHPTRFFTSEGCGVTGDKTGISGRDRYAEFIEYLSGDLRHNPGYTLLGDIQQKYTPYTSVNARRWK